MDRELQSRCLHVRQGHGIGKWSAGFHFISRLRPKLVLPAEPVSIGAVDRGGLVVALRDRLEACEDHHREEREALPGQRQDDRGQRGPKRIRKTSPFSTIPRLQFRPN